MQRHAVQHRLNRERHPASCWPATHRPSPQQAASKPPPSLVGQLVSGALRGLARRVGDKGAGAGGHLLHALQFAVGVELVAQVVLRHVVCMAGWGRVVGGVMRGDVRGFGRGRLESNLDGRGLCDGQPQDRGAGAQAAKHERRQRSAPATPPTNRVQMVRSSGGVSLLILAARSISLAATCGRRAGKRRQAGVGAQHERRCDRKSKLCGHTNMLDSAVCKAAHTRYRFQALTGSFTP